LLPHPAPEIETTENYESDRKIEILKKPNKTKKSNHRNQIPHAVHKLKG
jgi:hypothetical protein